MKNLQILALLFFLTHLYSLGQPPSLINKSDTILYLPYQDGKATFSYKGKMGVIDSSGKIIVPATFSRLQRLFDDGNGFSYRFYYDKKKIGVLDANFNILIPIGDYDEINIFREGFFRTKKSGKFSFVDKEGKCFDKWFDDAKDFENGFAAVSISNKWGFINEKSDLVINHLYDDVKGFSENNLAPIKLNGKWGFIDKTSKIIIPYMYDQTSWFFSGYCAVKFNGSWGYIDKENNVKISFQYKEAEPFFINLALVKKGTKYGYINIKNETIIPFEFSDASSFRRDELLAYVKFKGKWIHLNNKGEFVKLSYDE